MVSKRDFPDPKPVYDPSVSPYPMLAELKEQDAKSKAEVKECCDEKRKRLAFLYDKSVMKGPESLSNKELAEIITLRIDLSCALADGTEIPPAGAALIAIHDTGKLSGQMDMVVLRAGYPIHLMPLASTIAVLCDDLGKPKKKDFLSQLLGW